MYPCQAHLNQGSPPSWAMSDFCTSVKSRRDADRPCMTTGPPVMWDADQANAMTRASDGMKKLQRGEPATGFLKGTSKGHLEDYSKPFPDPKNSFQEYARIHRYCKS